MRTSVSSLAVIRRTAADGMNRMLAQWNESWKAFSFVGGHREEGETARQCLIREMAEELVVAPASNDPDANAAIVNGIGLAPDGAHVIVGQEPLGLLEYEAFSKSAQTTTRYEISLFEVGLSPEAATRVEKDAENRWLSEKDIERGKCDDGRAVSETVRRLLEWLRPRLSK
ncbi:NUDIX domain-containing protein [Zavarzinella formosa]|uniref:NUDIX domain-containing protein n=1 Tax=Zavarzinella formosa TaxID=360055 RepID=UPI000311D1A3|nr:NUDIX domain-containing protein [Zavarzinella formosa]